MKKFLLKSVIFAFIVLAILSFTEVWVRNIPNEYSYKYQYMEKNASKIEVLIIGASVGRAGLDPTCFTDNTFNLSNVSQDIVTDCALIDKYIDKCKKLKTIVWALSPASYVSYMSEGIENWRLRKYQIYMDMNLGNPGLLENFEVSNFKGCLSQIIRKARNINTVDCFELGMGRDSLVENEANKISQGKQISELHNKYANLKNAETILPVVDEALKKCKDHNITVLFILIPTYYTYYNYIDSSLVENCNTNSIFFDKKYLNVRYLNYFKDSLFTTSDFRNSNHLSQAGAKKLSLKLDSLLQVEKNKE